LTLLDRTYPLLRRILFRMDAEEAHERTLRLLSAAPGLCSALVRPFAGPPDPSLARRVGGVDVAGPVGLAAGLDKDGRAIPFWPAVGFGFVEVGTVTMHPQAGNPRPRLFRLVEEAAIINRMGFNNLGSEALAHQLRSLRDTGRWPSVPVGANLGKSKITELEDAPDDYATSARRLRGLVSWFTVNVSSPNTPGLRGLQDGDALRELLPAVMDAADGTPVWLKLAPDLTDSAIHDAVELARSCGLQAIVATNTTIRRDLLATDPNEAGGLSGRPLAGFAADRIRAVLAAADGGIDVVGVGGIETVEQVQSLLHAGCKAVQLYTGFIYQGPGLPSRLHRGLLPSVTNPS
jgi:dihydroorotate dehydrogenase